MAKNLILFFSRAEKSSENNPNHPLKGNSALIAETIQELIGGDLFQIETETPYPENYKALSKLARQELAEQARPKLRQIPELSEYENIFICGPCWWGTYPMAIFSALEKQDFKGKTIYPLISHEGSGAGTSIEDLKEICQNAVIQPGLALQVESPQEAREIVKEYLNQFESLE